ncbi:MAG: hypothetical protein VKK42_08920 [Lyngbya sp.]|nr:hypothetical protein [Lyngbya sp.]
MGCQFILRAAPPNPDGIVQQKAYNSHLLHGIIEDETVGRV